MWIFLIPSCIEASLCFLSCIFTTLHIFIAVLCHFWSDSACDNIHLIPVAQYSVAWKQVKFTLKMKRLWTNKSKSYENQKLSTVCRKASHCSSSCADISTRLMDVQWQGCSWEQCGSSWELTLQHLHANMHSKAAQMSTRWGSHGSKIVRSSV